MSDTALNLAKLKSANRYRILDCLRYAPLSRAELCEKIGLAKSSVTTITNEMIREGLLCEAGPAEKKNKAGRTRVLLDINDSFAFAVGIHFHRERISVAAVGLKGRVLFEFRRSFSVFSSPEEVLSYIKTYLLRGLSEAGLDPRRLVGIGVSSPGPLDEENGVILEPPNFPLFQNYPIVKRLQEDYGCPIFLENNAVSLALYEHYCVRPMSGVSLFVTVSEGVGGALLKNGELHRGVRGFTGEFGHISVDPWGEPCPCGNRGCLETYVTLRAMKRRFGFSSYPQVIDAALRGEKNEREIMDTLISTLGSALVTVTNLLDLDSVVLYGEYAYRSDRLALALESYLREHSLVCRMHGVSVLPSAQKEEAAAAAAAMPALNHFFKENTIFPRTIFSA